MYNLSRENINQVCTAYSKMNSFQGIQSANVPDSNQNVLNQRVDAGNSAIQGLQRQVSYLVGAVSDISVFNSNLKQNTREENSNYVRNKTQAGFVRKNRQYSSIGSIPRLPTAREEASRPSSNVASLIKAFAHPSSKFSVTGSLIKTW